MSQYAFKECSDLWLAFRRFMACAALDFIVAIISRKHHVLRAVIVQMLPLDLVHDY